MNKLMPKFLRIAIISNMLITSSCSFRNQTQAEVLQELGVNNQSDFSVLSPCEQIKIFSILAEDYTSIDHGVTLVPEWIDSEIAKHPSESVSACILEETNLLLKELPNYKVSYRIHGLMYKADRLELLSYPEIDVLYLKVACNEDIYANSGMIINYYYLQIGTDQDLDMQSMTRAVCGR